VIDRRNRADLFSFQAETEEPPIQGHLSRDLTLHGTVRIRKVSWYEVHLNIPVPVTFSIFSPVSRGQTFGDSILPPTRKFR
jgi:hypothetical protein